MPVSEKLMEVLSRITPDGGYDPWHGNFELYESNACNFDVLDGNVWYKIDAMHLESSYYEDYGVPDSILERARAATDAYWRNYYRTSYENPKPALQELLAGEFDDVRFVNMTYEPGRKIY